MAEVKVIGDQNSKVMSLAHYTNLAGFQGIIESGQLWASNVAFLNDREELLHGIKCAKRALSAILEDIKFKQWHDIISKVVEEIEADQFPNTYAACFCKKTDLLSQWRGYGGREQGVCLVFNKLGLEAMTTGKRSFLAPVQYGAIKGKQILRESLKERLLAIDKGDFTVVGKKQQHTTIYEVVSELIPRFKHNGFRGEIEWRLVFQHKTLRDSVKFRQTGNVLVPYIKISGEGQLPLKYIRVGPGPDIELTKRSVATFLKVNGYDVPVHFSSVPFRT